MPRLTRRRLLRDSALGAAGTLVAGRPAPVRAAPPQRVVVIGAGLAGLAAAWELAEAGHDVAVLEARTRAGGRVRTLRQPFADGLHAEAGGMVFISSDAEANRYIDALGLERAPLQSGGPRDLYHLGGRRFAVGPGEPPEWPYGLTSEEQSLGPGGIERRYIIDRLPAQAVNPAAWRTPELAALDSTTLADFMRAGGASEGAVRLLRHWLWFGMAIDTASMQSIAMADYPWALRQAAPFVVRGGNDALPLGMAAQLGQSVYYGFEVAAIEQNDSGVRVHGRHARERRTFEADRVVCTLPAPVLRRVELAPALPAPQAHAVADLNYLDVTRTFAQVRHAFWFDEGVTGAARTDLPIGQVERHPKDTAGAPADRAILESHVRGPRAAELAALSDDDIVARTLAGLEQVHPSIRAQFEGGVVKAWSRDPHAGSGFSMPTPGQVQGGLELLRAPHGRVHFAGEHTSAMRATMEGALRSGVRAAREIIALGATN